MTDVPPSPGIGDGGSGSPPPPPPSSSVEGGPPEPASGGTSGPDRGLVIGIVVAVLAALGVGAFFLLRDDDDGTVATSAATVPEPSPTDPGPTTPEPTALTVPEPPTVTIPVPSTAATPELTTPTFPELTLPTLPDLSIPEISIPRSPGTFAPPGSIPDAVDPPTDLGTDATLDGLAQDCYDGSMAACDDLYDEAPAGSDYRRYGDTCAGRQPPGTMQYCEASFPS